MRAWILVAAALATTPVWADSGNRYRLTGTGTLRADATAQTGGKLRMDATLQASDTSATTSPPLQGNGRFALMASITAASNACYNDTIFRDDFDGDGF